MQGTRQWSQAGVRGEVLGPSEHRDGVSGAAPRVDLSGAEGC